MPELSLNVGRALPLLKEQAGEGVPERVRGEVPGRSAFFRTCLNAFSTFAGSSGVPT